MYFILDNNDYNIGMSALPTDNCTDVPMKPLTGNDTARFNKQTNKWEYCFEKQKISVGETPYCLVGYSPSWMYTSDIYPLCGDICLEKSKDISVLIPCYGKSKYIKETVKSCLNQTMLPSNIIVLLMDDLSIAMKDDVESMSPLVKCIVHDQLNASAARTVLVNEYCPTDWFIFLDADDTLENNYIYECYNTPGSFIFARHFDMDEDGTIDYDIHDIPLNKKGHSSACLFNNLTSLMHKEVFNSIGLDENLSKGGEDFDFMVRLLEQKKYKVNISLNTCYYYRDTMGLANAESFFSSHYQSVIKNIEYLHSEYVAAMGRQREEDYFYHHQSLEEYAKFFNHGIGILFAEKFDLIRSKLWLSKMKDPISAFNSESFSLLYGSDGETADMYTSENYTFDVLFCEELNYYNIYDDLKMIVNNKILEDPEFNRLQSYNRLTYLLNNYCCFEMKVGSEYDDDLEALEAKLRANAKDNKIIQKQLEIVDLPKENLGPAPASSKYFPVSFVLHKECNLNCPYCNVHSQYRHNELSDDEIFENFDKNLTYIEEHLGPEYYIQPGVLGGEPTLWSDYLIKKIMNRLKDYRVVKLFTNGTNKNSLWYSYDNILFATHIVDWAAHPEKLTYKYIGKNEIPTVVVTHQETDKIVQIINDQKYFAKDVVVSHCAGSEDVKYNSTPEDIEKINEAQVKNKINVTALNHCSTFRVFSVDCNNNLTSRCCRHVARVPIEVSLKEFLEKDYSKCKGCIVENTLEK